MGIGDMLAAQRDEKDGAKYRALQTPEKIDQLALELSMMGVKVPPRDTAFFQAAVRKWLTL
jgi:hypothetical protein